MVTLPAPGASALLVITLRRPTTTFCCWLTRMVFMFQWHHFFSRAEMSCIDALEILDVSDVTDFTKTFYAPFPPGMNAVDVGAAEALYQNLCF